MGEKHLRRIPVRAVQCDGRRALDPPRRCCEADARGLLAASQQTIAGWLPPFCPGGIVADRTTARRRTAKRIPDASRHRRSSERATGPTSDNAAPAQAVAAADSSPSVQSMARDMPRWVSRSSSSRRPSSSSRPVRRRWRAMSPNRPIQACGRGSRRCRQSRSLRRGQRRCESRNRSPSLPAVGTRSGFDLAAAVVRSPCPQQLSQPAPPPQTMTEPDGAPVVRPPLPLR